MRILLSMHGEPGHHLGTFRLARALVARGHAVTYLGLPAVKRLVEEQGFAFLTFAGPLFDRPDDDLFRRYCTAIVDGSLDACLESARPDLLLCDSFLWYVALRALRLGIPTVQISTSLFLFDNPHIPPALSPITPRPGPLSAVRISLAWKLMHLKHLFTKRLASRVTGAYQAPLRMHHLMDTFHAIARASGVRCRRTITYVQDEIGPHLILPELVLCPAAFQFPGPLPVERRYCGDFIDFQRQEPPLPFDPSNRTIIFCSLGTSAASYPAAGRFFAAVAAASRLEPEWFFVLHVSDANRLGDVPSTANLLVTPWVPQLALLHRAAVMVTHGGLNSIMECVQCQVPMVILPCARDQPGNAARAAFHDLGLRADVRSITADRLRSLIATALCSPRLKAGLKRMKDQIDAEQGLQKALEFIEALEAGLAPEATTPTI